MQFIENIRLAFTSLMANKMRALLTMLGIIIGISAVIMITTIGTSIQKTLLNSFNSLGTFNYFTVRLWLTEDDVDITKNDFITREMLDELLEKYPEHFNLSSVTEDFGSATVTTLKGETAKISVTGRFDATAGSDHRRGRTICYEDSKRNKNTLYVSELFVRQYFGNEDVDPIGQTVTLNFSGGISEDFTIVGVCKLPSLWEKMYQPGTKDIDKVSPTNIPMDTGLKLFHQELDSMYSVDIDYNTDVDLELQQQELQDFFDEKYKEKAGIGIRVTAMQDTLDTINTVVNVITIAISVIAALSLIVGGVGVMNIMLVSITERTKEIGVRKALGAQNSAIRMQFVVEAIIICLIGGLIGILMGILGGMAIGWIAKTLVEQFYSEYAELISITIQPSLSAILVSVLFSIMIGVFFGYYPANKAAKMNPIDALRYD